MLQIATLFWVVLITILWIGIVAGVWALLFSSEEYPPNGPQLSTNE